MKEQVVRNLSTKIHAKIAADFVESYIDLVNRYRKGDIDGCLSVAGKFVENTYRAIENVRTGAALSEIKNASRTRTAIENDMSLPESLRVLVPRVAQAMVYDIRSKTGAVHVKEVDPRAIDASLAVHAASWVVAEFVRQYHVSDERAVDAVIASLMRTYTPLIESIDGQDVVTHAVSCELEILLLLVNAGSDGMSRTEIGVACQYTSSSISKALKKLVGSRYILKSKGNEFFVTGPGEKRAAKLVAEFQANSD